MSNGPLTTPGVEKLMVAAAAACGITLDRQVLVREACDLQRDVELGAAIGFELDVIEAGGLESRGLHLDEIFTGTERRQEIDTLIVGRRVARQALLFADDADRGFRNGGAGRIEDAARPFRILRERSRSGGEDDGGGDQNDPEQVQCSSMRAYGGRCIKDRAGRLMSHGNT
jgi:hypothetical protein